MEDLSLVAVDAFNDHANSYESTFMTFGNYDTAIVSFCAMIPGNAPRLLQKSTVLT